ncbi:MAG TPA: hypothetical protein VFP10_04580 [Candidatus Eisenbacteria bacterium]|nr:hypothetical protein [Candidatus Eisenbacteria bacterium]
MRVPRYLVLWSILGISLLCPTSSDSGGMGISTGPCGATTESEITTFDFTDNKRPFHLYKVPAVRSPYGFRDLEFLWSDTYKQRGKPLAPPGPNENDLDRFANTICDEQGKNPFSFPQTDIQLIYDFFNVRGLSFRSDSLYDTDEFNVGFLVATPGVGDAERNHIDTYLWEPTLDDTAFGFVPLAFGKYPSDFHSSAEDSLTTGDPAPYHRNSLHLAGPPYANVDDTGPLRWTRTDTTYNQGFNHEFEHAINNDTYSDHGIQFVHMLASAAEAVGGMGKDPPRHDVPYTWNLMRSDVDGGNYQAWQSFSAYVAYNFRGADTSIAVRNDDLVWRWARQSDRRLTSLIPRLSAAECAECTTRVYFQNRSPQDRFHLLIHNWRVAQFANKPSLAQGQFAFPPQFRFDPIRDIGNWKDIDQNASDDTANVMLGLTLSTAHITREITQAGRATPQNAANAHIMALEPFGANYWEIRSDPSLWAANRDLVIRVAPDQISAGRVLVSAVAYSEQNLAGGQPDSLWKHPEWAQAVFGPVWKDMDLPGGGDERIELVVPNFGQTYRAVVVTVTFGRNTPTTNNEPEWGYRLNTTLRTGSYQTVSPLLVQADTTRDEMPVFSPAGDEVAFQRVQSGFAQIYRKRLDGSPASPLIAQAEPQFRPDWSPRGDWVVFDQATASGCDIYAYNPGSDILRRLTTAPQHEFTPVFSPNGQRVAYVLTSAAGAQVRIVNLDGTGDAILVARPTAPTWLRWTRDGKWIFFNVGGNGDSLYAVVPDGQNVGLVRDSTELFYRAESFDVPPGNGRFLGEFLTTTLIDGGDVWGGCGPFPQFTCRDLYRVQARDAQTLASEALFYRTRANIRWPRWSHDGTRVAYTSDQYGTRDVFVGQVSYNHAPHLTNVDDSNVAEGVTWSFQLNATDADGELITYQAVSLPPGATLSPGGNFEWTSPGPLYAEYYVVFRALDGSGGVDHRVVRYFIVPAGGGGGCPMVDARTSGGWQFENSILGRSLTGDFATDVYRFQHRLEPHGDRYRIRIRENEQERTTLDRVGLWALDHDPSVRTFATATGVVLGERRAAYRVTTGDGRDVTDLLDGSGGAFQGEPGDTLLVEMNPPGVSEEEAPHGLLEEPCCEKNGPQLGKASRDPVADVWSDRDWLIGTGVLVQVPDGSGGWLIVQHRYPRESADQVALELGGQDRMRVIFLGRQRLAFMGRMIRRGLANPVELRLLAARHTRAGDVLGAVGQSDGTIATLDPGDTLSLEFDASPVPPGKLRDWFLVSTGVYTSDLSGNQAPTLAAAPARFALAQNRPNPFSRTTTIRFELPVASPVRVEVFDLLGRRLAILADREYPAGYHSVEWDRRTASGSPPSPGVLVYRIIAGTYRDQKKMILLP